MWRVSGGRGRKAKGGLKTALYTHPAYLAHPAYFLIDT